MVCAWGRRGPRGRIKENRERQRREVLLWLKKGWFEVNLKLVEHRSSISAKRFWALTRELMPPCGGKRK